MLAIAWLSPRRGDGEGQGAFVRSSALGLAMME
jgi:hypothetical protein